MLGREVVSRSVLGLQVFLTEQALPVQLLRSVRTCLYGGLVDLPSLYLRMVSGLRLGQPLLQVQRVQIQCSVLLRYNFYYV